MGTLVVILLGEGANAAVTLKRSYAEASGWIVVTAGWAFAVFAGVVTAIACGSPGAHLNPAVTVAVAIKTGDYSHMLSFFAAQMLGAFTGAVLVYLFYKDHFAITPNPAAKLGIFCTAPAIRNPLANLFSEILATAVLLLVIGAIGAKTFAPAGPHPASPPISSASPSGPSASPSAAPPATPSTPPATSPPASPTPCSPSPARDHPTGATPPSRSPAPSSVLSSWASSSASAAFDRSAHAK